MRSHRVFRLAALAELAWSGALAVLLSGSSLSGRAEDGVGESVGVRYGFSGNTPENRFGQVEAYATWNLPVRPDLGRRWSMQLQLDSSAGWLRGRGNDAFVGAAGPALELGREGFPVALVGGCNATWLSHDTFGNRDLGMPLQFTSHLGLEFRLGAHWELGYRYQHMSNGGLATPNPGLNMHMFSVGYTF